MQRIQLELLTEASDWTTIVLKPFWNLNREWKLNKVSVTDYLTWGDFRWNQNLKNWILKENERSQVFCFFNGPSKVLSKIIYEINISYSWFQRCFALQSGKWVKWQNVAVSDFRSKITSGSRNLFQVNN